MTELEVLFNLNPESAFNQDLKWVCHHHPQWVRRNKPSLQWERLVNYKFETVKVINVRNENRY